MSRISARASRWVCAFAGLVLAGAALAEHVPGESVHEEPVLEALPEDLGAEDLARYWSTASEIEHRALTEEAGRSPIQLSRDLEHASDLFLRVAEAPAGRPEGYWRAARAVWLSGEVLPLDFTDEKMERFVRADIMAGAALERNPDCGECMLWKFISMGRVATTGGVMDTVRALPEMQRLIDGAVAAAPTHSDGDDNSTLGNAHYSAAIFYRIVPDWLILKWMTGVRGDKKRALAHSRTALGLHPTRLDYQIEVGTQLLCIGSAKKKKDKLAEGKKVLREAIAMSPATEDERREIYFAHRLIEEPKKACGYTGDQFVDVEEEQKKQDDQKKKKKKGMR